MNEFLLSLALAFHAGPFRAEVLGFSPQSVGTLPTLAAGRLILEPPAGALRPYLAMTATHRAGSPDPADISADAGIALVRPAFRLTAGWVGTELEETFGPPTDGGAHSFFGVSCTSGF